MEIITLEGLKLLEQMNKEDRPKNWKELVLNYLSKKQKIYTAEKERLEEKKENIKEAVKICRKLGVAWIYRF